VCLAPSLPPSSSCFTHPLPIVHVTIDVPRLVATLQPGMVAVLLLTGTVAVLLLAQTAVQRKNAVLREQERLLRGLESEVTRISREKDHEHNANESLTQKLAVSEQKLGEAKSQLQRQCVGSRCCAARGGEGERGEGGRGNHGGSLRVS
jgi:hypothetical protein